MGEIVVKGENVMAGYWKNPGATADTVKDGWLYTGDLGYMSEEGLLYVKGRFKSLLISADGEKYSPEGIEESLVQHCEAIDQIMLYNNQSPITSALIVPAKDKLTRMGYDLSKEQGCRDALAEIDREIRQFLKGGAFYGQFPERWLPGTFAVLSEPFSEQNHMINSTMKLVRPKVEQIYKERLEYVYTSEGRKETYCTVCGTVTATEPIAKLTPAPTPAATSPTNTERTSCASSSLHGHQHGYSIQQHTQPLRVLRAAGQQRYDRFGASHPHLGSLDGTRRGSHLPSRRLGARLVFLFR